MPAASEAHEQKLPHRRNVYKRLRVRTNICTALWTQPARLSSFLLTTKRFFRKVLSSPGNPVPRVIDVDKNPAYPAAVERLKAEGARPRRVRLRQCKYLNNQVPQQ